MWKHGSIIIPLLFCSLMVAGQSLAELEKQLDSLLRKQERSELLVSVGFGNNPAYGAKTPNLQRPIVMKNFLSPSLSYYHKSGLFASASAYYLLNSEREPWFEWDFTAGYDYTKNRKFLTGISYTKYLFADSSDVPATPISNEVFAYFYYRGWWLLQPGISLDFGWGQQSERVRRATRHVSGADFNVITAVRHPFIFLDVVRPDDAVILTPSIGFTMGTAKYYSNLKAYQYMARSPKMEKDNKKKHWHQMGQIYETADHTGFEPRVIDMTFNFSYLIGRFSLSPSYTIFKPLQGDDKNIMSYFTARVTLTL